MIMSSQKMDIQKLVDTLIDVDNSYFYVIRITTSINHGLHMMIQYCLVSLECRYTV